jgi:hypothetical protein
VFFNMILYFILHDFWFLKRTYEKEAPSWNLLVYMKIFICLFYRFLVATMFCFLVLSFEHLRI